MTDTIESLRWRLTLAQRDAATLRAILAAEVGISKQRLAEIEELKRENAALKIRTATTTDQ